MSPETGTGRAGSSVLITGATGFVGSRLALALAAEGADVHVVVREGSNREQLEPLPGNLALHVHDGTTEGLTRIVTAARPEVVFHLASLFIPEHRPQDVVPLVDSNVRFGAQLAEALTAAGVEHLVNAGTAWQHFEDADYDPVCLYAATKQAFEDVLRFYTNTGRLRVVTLVLFDTYGPGDPRPKLFRFLREAARDGRVRAMSPGEQLIDLVHVDDAVEAFRAAAARLRAGEGGANERFAVSSGRPIRLRDLVAVYARIAGGEIRIEWGGRPYRPREVMRPWTRGEPLPGWQPRVSLEEGLAALGGERSE